MSAEPAKAPVVPASTPSQATASPTTTPRPKPVAPPASRSNSNQSGTSGSGRRNNSNARTRPAASKKEDAPSSSPTTTTTASVPAAKPSSETKPASATGAGNRRKSHSGQQAGGRNANRPAAAQKQNAAPGIPTVTETLAPAAQSAPPPRQIKSPAVSSGNKKGGKTSNGPEVSDALDSLKRVITDLRAIPPTSSGQGLSPGSTDPPSIQAKNSVSPKSAFAAPTPTTAAPSQSPTFTSKVPNPNAPTFHPARQPLDQLSEENEHEPSAMEVPNSPPPVAPRHLQQGVVQQQPMGQFVAPRFQALQTAVTAEPEVLSPTGRPVLAPGFTFGTRRQSAQDQQQLQQQQHLQQLQLQQQQYASAVGSMAGMGFGNDQQDQLMARSQSFAMGSGPPPSNVAPGMSALLGLAARAHRRTGSEMTPQLAQQVALQQQIEDLQRQQRELMLATQASPALPAQLTFAGRPPQLQQIGAHRRIQSVAPSPTVNSFGDLPPAVPRTSFSQYQPGQNAPPATHRQQPSLNAYSAVEGAGLGQSDVYGHSRSGSLQRGHRSGQFSLSGPLDWADEYSAMGPHQFANANGGHSRQGSRALDSSWRMNGGVGPAQGNGGSSGADLAQAQAQLQSIAAFRAAAGGGHSKMASFALPNMLPNLLYANAQTFFNIPQQMQAFQTQIQQQTQQTQRRSLFSPYLPAASLPPLLAAGKLVIGVLRVNKRNRSDAYVATEVLDADIYISGSRDRNRALDGDTVAIELLDVDEVWASKKEKEDKKRKKEENASFGDARAGSQAAQWRSDKRKDDVEVEGQGMMLFDDEEVTDEIKPQYAGHVVAVVERMPGQLFSGTLGLLRPSSAATKEKQDAERRDREGPGADSKPRTNERPKIVWFKPTDKRVPLIAISTEQAPADFLDNSEAYANVLFCACIKRWPITSLHPFGTLVEEVGPIGHVEVETSALLKDCNFPTEEFSESVLKCLPPMPWTIPEHEYEVRKDLRKTRIFTIDPSTAKDLDDALSITKNEDGTFEVGVHIADVSYFVKPNTALDRDARKKATSVYLVQRAVPMLPPALSEELCSLVPNVERLAFSAFFTLTKDGRVTGTSFSKSIIKSCAKLSYEDAQNVIEGKSLGDVAVDAEQKAEDVEEDIRNLNALALKMAERRIESGALRIDKLKLNFKLDEKGLPIDCTAYERKEANSLVEEFMLLANMTVATMVAANLPEQALLRRHEAPMERRLEGFSKKASRLGLPVDVSSGGAILKSFTSIEDPDARKLLEVMSTKAMHRAKYFCSGMLDIAKYGHYALNVPLYTHFTSPIRRYADVIVHRQLAACLEDGPAEGKFAMDRDTVAKTAQNCNMKKDGAKLAQEQSAHLFLCLLIQDLTEKYGPVVRAASVVNVLDQAFDVVIPEFGIEKRVHADQMPLENLVFDEHSSLLQLYWSDKDVLAFLAERDNDEHLNKIRRSGKHHAPAEVSTRDQEESALFESDGEDEEEAAEEIIVKGTGQGQVTGTTHSVQRAKSAARKAPTFEGLRTLSPGGHKVQDIKELMKVPVIISADLEKSPPVIKVFAVNPYSTSTSA